MRQWKYSRQEAAFFSCFSEQNLFQICSSKMKTGNFRSVYSSNNYKSHCAIFCQKENAESEQAERKSSTKDWWTEKIRILHQTVSIPWNWISLQWRKDFWECSVRPDRGKSRDRSRHGASFPGRKGLQMTEKKEQSGKNAEMKKTGSIKIFCTLFCTESRNSAGKNIQPYLLSSGCRECILTLPSSCSSKDNRAEKWEKMIKSLSQNDRKNGAWM